MPSNRSGVRPLSQSTRQVIKSHEDKIGSNNYLPYAVTADRDRTVLYKVGPAWRDLRLSLTSSARQDWWVDHGLKTSQALALVIALQLIIRRRWTELQSLLPLAAFFEGLVPLQARLELMYTQLLNESRQIVDQAISRTDIADPDEQRTLRVLGILQAAYDCPLCVPDQSSDSGTWTQDLKPGVRPEILISLDTMLSDRAGLFSCVAFMSMRPKPEVFRRANDRPHHEPLDQRVHRYTECASDVQIVLTCIPGDEPSATEDSTTEGSTQTCHFPAAHIAWLNGDQDAALELWRRSGTRNLDVDIAGTTLAHLAVTDRNLNALRDMHKHDPQALSISTRDRLCLSLLRTATIMDDRFSVSLLLGCGAKTDNMQELFDLAVNVGSSTVIGPLLETRLVQPPFTEHVRKAILGRHIDVAQALLQHLTLLEHHTCEGINMLAALAEKNDYHELAFDLRSIEQDFATRHMGLEDLAATQAQYPDTPSHDGYSYSADLVKNDFWTVRTERR